MADAPIDEPARGKVSLVKKVDEVAVATDEEKPGRRLTGRGPAFRGRGRGRRRRAGALADVPAAQPGQPVLPDHLPRRRAAAGVPRLPVGAAAARRRPAVPVDWVLAGAGADRLPVPGAAVHDRRRRRRLQRVPRPAGPARPVRRRHGRGAAAADPRGDAAAPPAGSCRSSAWSSSRTATTAACCRRPGRSRTPAWTSTRSSTRSTTPAAASTARRSTSPRPTSCCSRSTARCWNSPAPAGSSSTCRWRRSGARGSAPGRTAVAAGFLLGTVSGSGAATAVSVGAVTWPILRRAGYPPERAGGMLAAAGVGAILSPPTLGAAAFIIAEYLNVSYLTRCSAGR